MSKSLGLVLGALTLSACARPAADPQRARRAGLLAMQQTAPEAMSQAQIQNAQRQGRFNMAIGQARIARDAARRLSAPIHQGDGTWAASDEFVRRQAEPWMAQKEAAVNAAVLAYGEAAAWATPAERVKLAWESAELWLGFTTEYWALGMSSLPRRAPKAEQAEWERSIRQNAAQMSDFAREMLAYCVLTARQFQVQSVAAAACEEQASDLGPRRAPAITP